MSSRDWSPEHEALLRRIWPTGENLKPYLSQLGGRSYTTVVTHAHRMQLGSRKKTARGRVGYALDAVVEALKVGPATVPEIIKRTGLSMAPIYKNIRDSKPGRGGAMHIIEWRRRASGGRPMPVYALGAGENAPMPRPLSVAEKARMLKARKQPPSSPFDVAAGRVQVLPLVGVGRIYGQSMSVSDAAEGNA